MNTYGNVAGNSGVYAYALGKDYIDVEFNSGRTYRYNREVTGRRNVRIMKRLAKAGQGLCRFITANVRNDYAAIVA